MAWRYVNRVAHPALSQKQRLSEGHCYLFLACSFFPEDRKFLCFALSVPIGRSPSISVHKPRIFLQKFNMCDFIGSTQAFGLGLLVSIGSIELPPLEGR